jgi:dipeptidyl-peptidase 4
MHSSRWLPLPFLCLSISAFADVPQPITGANYPLAQKFTKEAVRLACVEANVFPQWIGKTDQFWYALRTIHGVQYWRVDPVKKTKLPLFDATKLAAQLSELSQTPVDSATINLSRTSLNDEGTKFKFVVGEFQYEHDLVAEKLTKLGKAPTAPRFPPPGKGGFQEKQRDDRERLDKDKEEFKDDLRKEEKKDDEKKEIQRKEDFSKDGYKSYSPDRKRYAFVSKFNLYLAEEGKEAEAVQLSTDGEEDYTFAGGFGTGFGGGGGGRRTTTDKDKMPPADRKTRANVTWTSDSKYFYANRTDTRGIQELFLVDSLSMPRPTLEKYSYPMPGEERIRKTEVFIVDAAAKKLTRLKPKYLDENYINMSWGKAEGELKFLRRDRLQRHLDIVTYDAKTHTEKVLLSEGFEAANLGFQTPRTIPETEEFLWWSERSGWGHFYLYGSDGKLKNAVTSGDWRASRIVDVDAKNRLLYFVGNGREAGESIYYNHLYRVRLDGTDLTCLDPGESELSMKETGGADHNSVLSPSRRFVVDNASRIDLPTRSVLRDERGTIIMELEKTNTDKLTAMGWKPPERFIVKAADGATDLYGNLWKPFDFNPNKKYPVIAHVYPGPQTEGVSHTFTAYQTNMQMAQLGFIVIQVGHRGGAPTRSKAYHSYGYFNLRDYGLADKKAAIEQLGARFPWVDIERVGIYGHSGGAFMSAAAMLQKPYNEFFKAAVASAGNHDNNIYNSNWSEQYHGMKLVDVIETKEKEKEKEKGRIPPSKPLTGFDEGDDESDEPQEKKVEEKKTEEKKVDLKKTEEKKTEAKKEETKKVDDKKVEEKKTEAKKEETKKVDDKKTEAKKEETKKVDEKKTEAKKEDVKKEDAKKEEAKKEAPKQKFEINVPTNAELAANLKGAILLVHGDMDNNVHPAGTMRLVDALIKANKRFDMLIIPGKRHGFADAQPYFTLRMWDFFAEHLLNDRQTKADILERDVKRK